MNNFLDRAVRPNILDVIGAPELVFSLVLANLMSLRTWDLAETVKHRETHDRMWELHRYVNSHFKHELPDDVVENWETLDLAEEGQRIGTNVVDHLISVTLHAQNHVEKLGRLNERADIRPIISKGRFPAYFYATIDEAAACRRLLGKQKHKPIGVTNCLDEAALIAALLCVFEGGIPQGLCFLGSAYHYSTFLAADSNSVWFNGKKDFFTSDSWKETIEANSPEEAKAYFESLMYMTDTIITLSGHFDAKNRVSSIPEPELRSIASEIVDFFGEGFEQIQQFANLDDVHFTAPANTSLIADTFASDGAKAMRARIHNLAETPSQTLARNALYSHRGMSVPDAQPYLAAACRSLARLSARPSITSLDDAFSAIRSIAGTESIFGDRNRIAMPDEVLHYRTGSDRDKALLLYCLLSVAGESVVSRQHLSIRFAHSTSYVSGSGFTFDISAGKLVEAPEEEVEFRWSISLDSPVQTAT
jgi:hypothetical protein